MQHHKMVLTSFLCLSKVITRADNSLNLLLVHHHGLPSFLQHINWSTLRRYHNASLMTVHFDLMKGRL